MAKANTNGRRVRLTKENGTLVRGRARAFSNTRMVVHMMVGLLRERDRDAVSTQTRRGH